jgi:hypothetical protein
MFRRYNMPRDRQKRCSTEVHSDRMPVGSTVTNIAQKQTYLRTNR